MEYKIICLSCIWWPTGYLTFVKAASSNV